MVSFKDVLTNEIGQPLGGLGVDLVTIGDQQRMVGGNQRIAVGVFHGKVWKLAVAELARRRSGVALFIQADPAVGCHRDSRAVAVRLNSLARHWACRRVHARQLIDRQL